MLQMYTQRDYYGDVKKNILIYQNWQMVSFTRDFCDLSGAN